MTHCPGCHSHGVSSERGTSTHDCPGLVCAKCAEREAAQRKWGVYPCDQCAAKNEEIAILSAERDALRRHYDAAGPEHNLLALLDHYDDERREAHADLAAARSISIKQWKLTVREFELKLKKRDDEIEILEAKVADLRADLRACALALKCVRHASPSWSIDFAACEEVLNRRGVQAILRSTP